QENLSHNYSQIANIYSLRSQDSLALLYAEQAVKFSEQANKIDYAAEHSSFVAVELARLGRFSEAQTHVNRAVDYLDKLEAGRPRDYTEANVLINAGEVAARSSDVPRALSCYDKAEALINLDEGHMLPTIKLLRDRAKVFAAAGQKDKAHSDLTRAIGLIERNRANLETSDQRIQFLAASHSTFDQLISLDVDAFGHTSEAYGISESSRARALLDKVSDDNESAEHRRTDANRFTKDAYQTGQVTPLQLSEVQSRLPADLTLLEYVVTGQRTYVFLVTRSRFKVLESAATSELLDRLVHAYVSDLQQLAPLDDLNEKARMLYDLLIKPVEQEISGNGTLCIVPDEALHFLPFAALIDRSDKYLVDSHPLTYAPSASVLIRCIKEYQSKQAQNLDKILAVGDPEFDRDSFSNLSPLPDAEREAIESGRLYGPASVVLTRGQATEPSVVAAMKGCDVVHLALHCLVVEGSPGLAALVLAGAAPSKSLAVQASGPAVRATAGASSPERSAGRSLALPQASVNDPNDGLLFLKELDHIRLPRTKLVVLSACQSGLGQYYRGEGIVSLIRPFLSSGVPTVVASLWPVNSEATSDLMVEFHGQRKLANKRVGDALRDAQIKLRQNDQFSHPYYWAPFIAVGADN
ncbi:MAG TPA: CHAT domain-containing protein, partial [Blastocatellia bacterium]|nr:CHAT domain-containing protein [Blastocatellia bacterium]